MNTQSNISLTDNEIAVLKSALTYDSRESQLQDNPCHTGPEEISELLGWTLQQAGGLISSLEKKGLAFMDEDPDWADCMHLTHAGINAIFDIIEAGK